jgi:hypothetical protein
MDFYVQMAITVLTAGIGWLVVHAMTSQRDRRNRLAAIRIEILVEAIRNLQSVVSTGIHDQESTDKLQNAVNDLYLLGNDAEILATLRIMQRLTGTHEGAIEVHELLSSLRNTIRSEVGLPALKTPVSTLSLRYKARAVDDANSSESVVDDA